MAGWTRLACRQLPAVSLALLPCCLPTGLLACCLQNGSSWADTVEAEEKAEQQQQPGGSAPAEEDDDGASLLAWQEPSV